MTCDNTIGTAYTLPKAVLTPNSTIILPAMNACYQLTLLPKTITTNELVHELLLIWEPLLDWVRLTSTTIRYVLKSKLRVTYCITVLHAFRNLMLVKAR